MISIAKVGCFDYISALFDGPACIVGLAGHVWSEHQSSIPWSTEWVSRGDNAWRCSADLAHRCSDLRKLSLNLIPFPRVSFSLKGHIASHPHLSLSYTSWRRVMLRFMTPRRSRSTGSRSPT